MKRKNDLNPLPFKTHFTTMFKYMNTIQSFLVTIRIIDIFTQKK